MTRQPDRFYGPYPFADRAYIIVEAIFDNHDETTLDSAKHWLEEQKKIAEEINSWVDEELRDYPSD